jgi:hypothetical protein
MGQRGAEKLLQYTDLALEVVSDMQLQGPRRQWILLCDTTVDNYRGSRYELSG